MSSKDTPLFAFFGTSQFVTYTLDALEAHGLLPALVITAPDRPAGRGMKMTPSPVKEWAQAHGIDVLTPTTLKDEALVAELANTQWDFFLVASYGKMLPKKVLDTPRSGCLNIHPSLLPKYRGPSPFVSAILHDDRQTGVTIMEMAEKMDAGPVVAQARIEIDESEWPLTSSVLSELLFTEGANLFAEILPDWLLGKITPVEQDESAATYTKKYSSEDAKINLDEDPRKNLLKIRAFDKNPRAYFLTPSGKRVIITDAALEDGTLKILKVIPEGKKETTFENLSKYL
jgi:methionyl-tRNA formyltransferase